MEVTVRKIEEHQIPGKRLGRHIKHDPRSRNYPVRAILDSQQSRSLRDIVHKRMIPPLDQGDIGSCVGNAAVGCLETLPLWVTGQRRSYNEVTAVALYSWATKADPVNGLWWPPNDTGSNGVDVCQAAVAKGYMKSYHHCFSLQDVLDASQQFPVMIGANWYDSMDQPDSKGVISISPDAQVRGGHEWELSGIVDVANQMCKAWNSWGVDFGDGGAMYLSFETLDRLLSEQGDATVPQV